MSLLVTGSIGIDSVVSPYGSAENVLGGTAVYFAFAASVYVPVRLVAVVGDDFPDGFRDVLGSRNIDLSGLEVRRGSQTFRWSGRYEQNLNDRTTLHVDLNVLAEAGPKVPAAFADSENVFLANTHPTLQRELLAQLDRPKLVVCDTMDLWIENERESLLETFRAVSGVIINDAEARQLTSETNMIVAGEALLKFGPRFVIIKKGEHGAILVSADGAVAVPAYPSKDVRDPTGAGDSFAGGLLGYLAEEGKDDPHTLRRALVHGTVAASFTIEDFSVNRLKDLTRSRINQRVDEYLSMLQL